MFFFKRGFFQYDKNNALICISFDLAWKYTNDFGEIFFLILKGYRETWEIHQAPICIMSIIFLFCTLYTSMKIEFSRLVEPFESAFYLKWLYLFKLFALMKWNDNLENSGVLFRLFWGRKEIGTIKANNVKGLE